ncbi:MAG: HK97 family phage prohead protease [Sphingomonadaceae bacterium]
MLTGFADGGLELRQASDGSAKLQGRFPYNSRAVLSDGGRTGRPRKEQFAPGAFKHSVETQQEVHLLVGHSFDRPLASRGAGSLKLRDTADALLFEAAISPAMSDVGFVRDAMAALSAGLIVGISPGFRIPPQQTVPDAEEVTEEDPSEGRAIIRTIRQAMARGFRGMRGRVLVRESVNVTAAGGPAPQTDLRPLDVTPNLEKAMTKDSLAGAKSAIEMTYGVLPGLSNPATTGPLVREAQRHLAQWTLQPIARMIAQEASDKLGGKVTLDCIMPLQAFDAGGRARAFGAMVSAMVAAKEAGLDPQTIEDSLKFIDWADG